MSARVDAHGAHSQQSDITNRISANPRNIKATPGELKFWFQQGSRKFFWGTWTFGASMGSSTGGSATRASPFLAPAPTRRRCTLSGSDEMQVSEALGQHRSGLERRQLAREILGATGAWEVI